MTPTKELHPSFKLDRYVFRRKVFKLFGGAFHVYDENRNVALYSRQKAFKLKEDFRIFSNEQMEQELLNIKTPQILDIGATYSIQDSTTGEQVGAVRRKALKSIIRDEWVLLSNDNREIGKLAEKSMLRAVASRFINLIPQVYAITSEQGNTVAEIHQHMNPFVLKYTMDIQEGDLSLDRRLILASGILLAGIERRQQ